MTSTPVIIQGKDIVSFMRLYSERKTVVPALIPYQTGMSFGVSTDTDSTATKDGTVNSTGAPEYDFSMDFQNNTSVIADKALDAAMGQKKIEAWKVNRARFNEAGECEAWYVQGIISEDSGDNDADAAATRSLTITVDGTPKHGWLKLTDETQEQIDYVFHGLGLVTDAEGETDAKGVADGTAWDNEKDNGMNAGQDAAPATTPTSGAESTTPADPAGSGSGSGAGTGE